MLKRILFIILIVYSTSFIFSQSYRINRIIETNLFELDNNQLVKIFGLYIPTRQDTNQTLVELANTIYKWEIGFIPGRDFKFDFINENNNDTLEAIVHDQNTPWKKI